MSFNHKTVAEGEVVEVKAKEPGKIRVALTNAKTKITTNKYLKTAVKVVAVAGAAAGGFVIGRMTSSNSNDADQQEFDDDFEYIDDDSLEDSENN